MTSGTLILTQPHHADPRVASSGPFECRPQSTGIRPVFVRDLDHDDPCSSGRNVLPQPVDEIVMSRCAAIRLRPGRVRG